MHITLHLTTGCNLNCDYCYAPHSDRIDMSPETLRQAIDFTTTFSSPDTGLIYFGGEPLLKKELISEAIEYSSELARSKGISFHHKVTTNGLLMDETFLKYASASRLTVALSIDGTEKAHNSHRKNSAGEGSYGIVSNRAKLLLKFQPYAQAYMVISPDTVQDFHSSFLNMLDKGFRYIVTSLDHSAEWTDKDLTVLKKQYGLMAKEYERLTENNVKFYFSPFEKKIASHIRGEEAVCIQCQLGKKQVSIAPNGSIYPCVQFVQDGVSNTEYSIGHISSGIDTDKVNALYEQSQSCGSECTECAFNLRCEHRCGCLNWQTTGNIGKVSPLLCETERLLIPIADRLAERLFKKRNALFIQKHYNVMYPMLSYLEDVT